MTGDTVDPYLAYIQGHRWLQSPAGPAGPGAEVPEPDIDKLLEEMNSSLETYQKIADDINIHFPDENSWTNMSYLADNIWAFAKFYYNNNEKREKFLPVLRGIDKVFNDMTASYR